MSKPLKQNLSARFSDEEADQVRAAHHAVGVLEGYASISEFIVASTMKEVKRLQHLHNGDRAWDPLPVGVVRPGERTRNEVRASEERTGRTKKRLKSGGPPK